VKPKLITVVSTKNYFSTRTQLTSPTAIDENNRFDARNIGIELNFSMSDIDSNVPVDRCAADSRYLPASSPSPKTV